MEGAHRQPSEIVKGVVIREIAVEPGGYLAIEVKKGQVLRIIDMEGHQVADFVCFNLHRLEERLSPQNTIMLNKSIRFTTGHSLFSDEAGKMFTVIEDTAKVHDLLAGACSRYTNYYRYGAENTPNCRDNLARAVEPYGLKWKDIPYNLNVFMNVPIRDDGTVTIEEPVDKAGDYIDLRADMDVLAALSNCPQVLNPCNSWKLKPLKVILYEPE